MLSTRLVTPLALLSVIGSVFLGKLMAPAGGVAQAVETADLQEQLESALKARRPVEFAFIERVVTLLEEDVLPLSLVNSAFLYARKQPRHKFQYFERGVRVRARRLGIEI